MEKGEASDSMRKNGVARKGGEYNTQLGGCYDKRNKNRQNDYGKANMGKAGL